MDLAVVPPCGVEISYRSRRNCGGELDRDNLTGTGPENIFWTGGAARGLYTICVNAYRISGFTSFRVDVVEPGRILATYAGTRSSSVGDRACARFGSTYVADFVY